VRHTSRSATSTVTAQPLRRTRSPRTLTPTTPPRAETWQATNSVCSQSGGRNTRARNLFDARAHEALNELTLEHQEGDQQRRDGEQGSGRDDGEVDP